MCVNGWESEYPFSVNSYESEYPKTDESSNIYESGKISSSVNLVLMLGMKTWEIIFSSCVSIISCTYLKTFSTK